MREFIKLQKDKINTGKDIHENNYAPDPSIHWKKETNDAANHITTQEVVDLKIGNNAPRLAKSRRKLPKQ